MKDLMKGGGNYRYLINFSKRLRHVGLVKFISEIKLYSTKWISFPSKYLGEKPDIYYKLFVFYNYFKIVAIKSQISSKDLINTFPTRLQQYFLFKLDPKDRKSITYNKDDFYRECANAGIPYPKTYFKKINSIYYNEENEVIKDLTQLSLPKVLFVKPISDNGGKNAYKIDTETILRHGMEDGLLAQDDLKNHSSIRKISSDRALNTFRIITYIDNYGYINILSSILRLSKDKSVDNWGQGSINVEVLPDGTLGGKGITKYFEYFSKHPDSRISFEGYKISEYPNVVETVIMAAEHFKYLRLVAWDIALCEIGPVIVESNSGCDFFHAQLFTPYGDTILIHDLMKNCNQ